MFSLDLSFQEIKMLIKLAEKESPQHVLLNISHYFDRNFKLVNHSENAFIIRRMLKPH